MYTYTYIYIYIHMLSVRNNSERVSPKFFFFFFCFSESHWAPTPKKNCLQHPNKTQHKSLLNPYRFSQTHKQTQNNLLGSNRQLRENFE